jgi:hypothetical protein
MTLALSIAGQALRIDAAVPVLDAIVARYRPFVVAAAGPGALAVEVRERPGRFQPVLEREGAGQVRAVAPARLVFEGAARGELHLDERRGRLDDVTGLGPIDGLIRAALAALLPLDGALLLHAALVGDVALCGDSGAGKSTAARALGGVCDELVVARPTAQGIELQATPYWQGRPLTVHDGALACLARGGTPSVERLTGSAAARAILRYVVRYVALVEVERAILALAARAAAGGVRRFVCPEGAAYLPFLVDALSFRRAA